MCGIAGVYRFDGCGPVPPVLVTAMRDDLRHRGPDGEGDFAGDGGRLRLGHTRLAIIDLAGGAQPMSTADGRLTVVFNGEIYDYARLRGQLAHRCFRTRSDTEVILHLYDEYGLDGIARLGGMFAFALWDAERRRLVLARDRLGIKPLYWTVANGALAFASDAAPLLRVPGVTRDVDRGALRYFLALRAVPAPLTLFQQVRKLPPGHLLVCERGRVGEPVPYWRLEDTRRAPDARGGTTEELRGRIQAAVRDQMVSDVPVGALLSGGVDSTLIAACMRGHTERLHTFSVGAPAGELSELPYARLAAQRIGTQHHDHVLTPDEVLAALPPIVDLFADPVADPAAIPLWVLAAAVREAGIKVVLCGEGSDELFAGYPDYAGRLAGAWRRLLRPVQPYLGHAALSQRDALRRLLPGDEGADFAIVERHRATAREAGMDALQTMLFLDLKTRIPDDLLARTDRVTMARGLEARVPFLDHALVEHAFWLPSSLKIRAGNGKHVLKEAARPLVPDAILRRPKMGFPTPVRRWTSGAFGGVFRRWLLDVHEEPRCFDARVLEAMVDEHFGGRRDWGLLLWRIWFFKLWHAVWVDGRGLDSLRPPAHEAFDPVPALAGGRR